MFIFRIAHPLLPPFVSQTSAYFHLYYRATLLLLLFSRFPQRAAKTHTHTLPPPLLLRTTPANPKGKKAQAPSCELPVYNTYLCLSLSTHTHTETPPKQASQSTTSKPHTRQPNTSPPAISHQPINHPTPHTPQKHQHQQQQQQWAKTRPSASASPCSS